MHNQALNVIVGLGKTGFSCLRYLLQRGENVAVIDSRQYPPYLDEFQKNFPDVPLSLGSFAIDWFDAAKTIILSPGVARCESAIVRQIERGAELIGDIELFARAAKAPVIAITGSNGKSTVTTLVGLMAARAGLKVAVGGNLGTPALDLLSNPEPELYVLELSSFQLENTYSLTPKAAVILNISEDHLDRYENFNAYKNAKKLIYRGAKNIIFNRDDPASFSENYPFLDGDGVETGLYSFGLTQPAEGEFGLADGFLCYGNEKLIATYNLKVRGRHQSANALAALALGKSIGLPFTPMLEALRNFTGLKHRCQWLRTLNDVSWYNDSKGTNVGATAAAIAGIGADISGKVVLIAGGLGKGANFSILEPAACEYVRAIVLIGKDAPLIAAALKDSCQLVFAVSMHEAVEKAALLAKPNDAVLLSPACASFDMFDNFEHRGKVFTAEVMKLL